MSSSPSTLIKASNIPKITELRNKLNYGNALETKSRRFHDDLRVYRNKFLFEDGTCGARLNEWQTEEAQAKLHEITVAYLERDGNGVFFWPKEDSHPNKNTLEYPKDRNMIMPLIKQLIFRLNQQQYRNAKYKGEARRIMKLNNRTSRAQSRPSAGAEDCSCESTDGRLSVLVPSSTESLPALEVPAVDRLLPPTNHASGSGNSTVGVARPAPAIEINYHIVLSKSPVYRSIGWQPSRALREMSLTQLLSEIPLKGDTKGLGFTLEGPGLHIKDSIECGKESGFMILKKRFNKGISAALDNNAASIERLTFDLEIELLTDAAVVGNDVVNFISFF